MPMGYSQWYLALQEECVAQKGQGECCGHGMRYGWCLEDNCRYLEPLKELRMFHPTLFSCC